MTAAWLWQADGPLAGARGVCGEERRARELAAERLRAGLAAAAVVDEAVAELGMRTIEAGYHRTGRGWAAALDGRGRVRWSRVVAR